MATSGAAQLRGKVGKGAQDVMSGPSGISCTGDLDMKLLRDHSGGTRGCIFWNTVAGRPPTCHCPSQGPSRPNEAETASPTPLNSQEDACQLRFLCAFLGMVEAFLPAVWRVPGSSFAILDATPTPRGAVLTVSAALAVVLSLPVARV